VQEDREADVVNLLTLWLVLLIPLCQHDLMQ
jgi:hypothetical protein